MRHCYVVGRSGTGKTNLLQQLFIDGMENDRGVAIIDPHGDLAETLLQFIPKHRTNDTIYFDAGDRQAPVTFNPLACKDPEQRPLIASGIVSAVRHMNESWGPRLEDILRNAALALCEYPDTTILSILDMLTDVTFRKQVAERCTDPVVKQYWNEEFGKWKPQDQAVAVASVTNKVRAFATPQLRAIFDDPNPTLSFDEVMNGSKILICNLSKGRCGEEASRFLGSLLVTELQLAAMRRASIAEADRQDFTLYVDEIQNVATTSFATLLSESRKYRVALVLAHQFVDQLDQATTAAVAGNAGSTIAFRVGANDAQRLAEQLAGDVTAEDLLNLPNYQAVTQILVDGVPTQPFTMKTLPPKTGADPQRAETVRRTSKKRYGRLLKIAA